MKRLICFISLLCLLFCNTFIVNAEEININESITFIITDECYTPLKNFINEQKYGINFIDNYLCVTIGKSIDAELGDYITLTLKDSGKIVYVNCIVCGISNRDTAIDSIVATNTSKTFISLSTINDNWTGTISKITVDEDKNYLDDMRNDLVKNATQYVGNPYVWGGESLTNGCDCSGFTMKIFEQYGYELPHSAETQASYGREVEEADLKIGDLIFYPDDTGIGHVAIYIGDNKIVHASNSAPYPDGGIKISQYNYRSFACIRRLI